MRSTFPECPNANYKDPDPLSDPKDYCCRDALDPVILNCDERRYITYPERSVRIGSFAAGMVWQRASSITNPGCDGNAAMSGLGSEVDRLLIAVRGKNTFAHLLAERGTGEGGPGRPGSARCLEPGAPLQRHRQIPAVRRASPDYRVGERRPAPRRALRVGPRFRGRAARPRPPVGYPDTPEDGDLPCSTSPRKAPRRRRSTSGPSGPVFPPNSSGLYGVTSLTPRRNGNSYDVFATSRFLPLTNGVRTTASCPMTGGQTYANLVVIGAGEEASTRTSAAASIRGIEFPSVANDQQAFVLQRSPPALVGFDGETRPASSRPAPARPSSTRTTPGTPARSSSSTARPTDRFGCSTRRFRD